MLTSVKNMYGTVKHRLEFATLALSTMNMVQFKLPRIKSSGLRRSVQEMLRKSKPSTRRAEIQHLYQKHLSGETLSVSDLLLFLHKEQMDLTADEDTAEGLISRYEIEQSGK